MVTSPFPKGRDSSAPPWLANEGSLLLPEEDVCASAVSATEHNVRAEELPRTPYRRSSQKTPSTHSGEWGITPTVNHDRALGLTPLREW